MLQTKSPHIRLRRVTSHVTLHYIAVMHVTTSQIKYNSRHYTISHTPRHKSPLTLPNHKPPQHIPRVHHCPQGASLHPSLFEIAGAPCFGLLCTNIHMKTRGAKHAQACIHFVLCMRSCSSNLWKCSTFEASQLQLEDTFIVF